MQTHFNIKDINEFKSKALNWVQKYDVFAYLDSNSNSFKQKGNYNYNDYDLLLAVKLKHDVNDNYLINSFSSLDLSLKNNKKWHFGYLGYDLKNQIEKLESRNFDGIDFPDMHFFVPSLVILIKNHNCTFLFQGKYDMDASELFSEIKNVKDNSITRVNNLNVRQKISKEEYLSKVKEIKRHIHRGDIYEINFCQEFYSENTDLDPIHLFQVINSNSPAPFSCIYRLHNRYLVSISPERFIKKIGRKIISQPMKGTAKRGKTSKEDEDNKQMLRKKKEMTENIMITDLVRNDLSKTALKGTVKVEELCGIYSFQQAHQMISTISSEIHENTSLIEIIKNAFPMGSMTGAPKIRAMELIEKFEVTKRGLYSGSLGYFNPNGNFDFNVIIRSILYNLEKKYVSFSVGSAITSQCDPESEYNECLVKAAPMINALKSQLTNTSI